MPWMLLYVQNIDTAVHTKIEYSAETTFVAFSGGFGRQVLFEQVEYIHEEARPFHEKFEQIGTFSKILTVVNFSYAWL